MATTTIPVGRQFTMTSATVYAWPAAAMYYTTQGAGTLQYSNDNGSTWTNAPAVPGPLVGALQVRANAGDVVITINHK